MVGGKLVKYDPEIHDVRPDPHKYEEEYFKKQGYSAEEIEIIIKEPSFRLLKEEALREQKPIAQTEWEKNTPKYKSLIKEPIPESLYVDKKFEEGNDLVFKETNVEGVKETENKALLQLTGDRLRTTSEPVSPPRHSLINKTHLPLVEKNVLGKGQRLGRGKSPPTKRTEETGRKREFKDKGGLSVEDLVKMPMDARSSALLEQLTKPEKAMLNS